ncbi:MAG: creatininase family protein [Rhodospirillales bacterium]|nr:creatininase family protein [Rhodospirillales bacterium]
MLLHQSTWAEVEAYLQGSNGIVMPIGSTEQHGPVGMIGTDSICAEVIAKGVGEAAGAMVGPTIGVGMSEHHMRFPGSMTLKPSTLVLVVRDYVISLAAHGFRRFLFVNGHGGNLASLQAAFSEVYGEVREPSAADTPDVRCKAINWWQFDPLPAMGREMFGAADGSHAAASEVAVAQFADAANIREGVLDPEVAPRGSFFGADTFRERFPDGRIGSNSALASPEKGERLYAKSVEAIVDSYRAFLTEA